MRTFPLRSVSHPVGKFLLMSTPKHSLSLVVLTLFLRHSLSLVQVYCAMVTGLREEEGAGNRRDRRERCGEDCGNGVVSRKTMDGGRGEGEGEGEGEREGGGEGGRGEGGRGRGAMANS